jgi:ABC-type phosphate/phosphonate transport system permease subunit
LAWFILLFILTVLKTGFFIIEAQGMLFFTLGIWISKSHLPLDRKPVWCSTTLCWLIFCGLAFIKTWMAFEFEEMNFQNAFIMSVLHYISVTTGIMAVWFSGDKIVSWCMSRHWFVWATSFAFIIYALHVPILPYVTRLFYMMLDGFTYYRLFTFFAAPLLVFFFCLAAGAIWRRLWPSGYRLATGGRGF